MSRRLSPNAPLSDEDQARNLVIEGDNLQVLASALRAGHSFVGALAVVANDAPEPARSEFQRVIGAHLLYRIDLANDEAALGVTKRAMAALASRCPVTGVAVAPIVLAIDARSTPCFLIMT